MKIRQLASFSVVGLCLIAASDVAAAEKPKPPERIPVFVRTAQSAGGFTDPSQERGDSAKDLVARLASSKMARSVGEEGDALVVLEVLSRETRREFGFMGPQNKSFLTVRLTAGEYSSDFTGESGPQGVMSGYGAAAGHVVKQLDAWVAANRQRLLAPKPQAAPAPSPEQ